MCLMSGAPANPPNALAAALHCSLNLTATPRVLNCNSPGQANVLFASEADATKALAATNVVLLGRPIRLQKKAQLTTGTGDKQALRLFISGDRSQVGKSTVCLGLLGALLAHGYRKEDIAYIKPATQCERPQLVGKFCAARGIANQPIGPIVYYSGFTRAFLNGDTETAEEMLAAVRQACDAIGRGKKVMVVDGVGYPAVGSITQTSNAVVAQALGAPVLLVGKSGVGDAVDSYCLNRAMFELAKVPVLGSVFNRLADDQSYYSLENCKSAVSHWFDQAAEGQRAYGFLPQMEGLSAALAAGDSAIAAPKDAAAATAAAAAAGKVAAVAGLSAEEEAAIGRWVAEFNRRVDVATLLDDARAAAAAAAGQPSSSTASTFASDEVVMTAPNAEDLPGFLAGGDVGLAAGRAAQGASGIKRPRSDIEALASQSGVSATAAFCSCVVLRPNCLTQIVF